MLEGILVGPARNAIPQYRQFEAEARRDSARFIEAEHMLLALAAATDSAAGRVLAQAGLDHERLLAAIIDEHRHSLGYAGMKPLAQGSEGASGINRPVLLGTSAKTALRRALHERHRERGRRGRLGSADLLIGLLLAELGTVPRALALAGIDRQALIARARTGVGRAC
jgi:ATP-dependent Clp protease ATP-binding subunit ClpA